MNGSLTGLFQIRKGNQDDDSMPIENIIEEVRRGWLQYKRVPIETVIQKELECERNQDWKSKWKLIGSDTVEVCGQLYKRTEPAIPFIPICAMLFWNFMLKFSEECSILVEYVLLPTGVREMFMQSRMVDLYQCLKSDKTLKPPTCNFKMHFRSAIDHVVFCVNNGMVGTLIEKEKDAFSELEAIIDEKEYKLLVSL